ncbi:MAG: tetratricopeptide repeat protein [Verrucomicrobiales bacterium]|nr:tetratricopeptide repeat protein [Verrucomicrobiales bacterium]
MNPDALNKQLRFLLDAGANRAKRIRLALHRTKAAPDLYVPALCRLASQENLVIGLAAAKVLAKFATTSRTAAHLFLIIQHLPPRCAPLASVAIIAMRRFRQVLHTEVPYSDGMLAVHWNNVSERLAEAGQKREALQAAREAVRLARRLQVPDDSGFSVVDALQTYSKRLGESGNLRQALTVAEEAARLSEISAFPPNPASIASKGRTLTLLANRLKESGDSEGALRLALQAKACFQGSPPASESALAALAVANIQLDRGDFPAAMGPAMEAHDLFRILASEDAVGWWEYLLAAANALSIALAQVGRTSEALGVLGAHLDGYQTLADRYPHSHGADFVAYLLSYSASLGEAGETQRALSLAQEATRRARGLRGPSSAHRLLLEGKAQNILFTRFYETGDFRAARGAARRAVQCFLICQRRFPSDLISEHLARAQRHLAEAVRLMARTRTGALRAVEVAEAAVATAHASPDSRSNAQRQLLAQCYSTLSMCHQDAGSIERAMAVEERSLRLRRRLFVKHPSVFRRDLAFSLRLLGAYRLDLGRARSALRCLEESDQHYRAFQGKESDYPRMLHAAALGLAARAHELLGEFENARDRSLTAIGLLTAIFDHNPQLAGFQLAPLLQQYQQLCEKQGFAFDAPLLAWIQAHRSSA